MPFTFSSESQAHCKVYSLNGAFIDNKLDRSLINDVQEDIAQYENDFIFNLCEMEYVNSTGINVFVRILRLINENKRKIVFVDVPEKIEKLFDVMKLNNVFTIKKDLSEGIEFLDN